MATSGSPYDTKYTVDPGTPQYYTYGGQWTPGMAAPQAGTKAYEDYQAYGKGQANAGAAAAGAGNTAAAYQADRNYYAGGGTWTPGGQYGHPIEGEGAYADYQSFLRGQGNASAAAGAAGNLAAATQNPTQVQKRADDEALKNSSLDFTKMGSGEQYWADNQGKFGQTTQTQGYLDENKLGASATGQYTGSHQLGDSQAQAFWEQNQGNMGQPGVAEQYADMVLKKYGGGSNLPTDPGLGTYYDRQEQKLTQSMNDQLSARGAYGSSVGLGSLASGIADLRADQARNEADYNLRRSANERDWMNSVGSLANQGQNATLSRWNAGQNAATGADTGTLGFWNAGLNGAQATDTVDLARWQAGLAGSQMADNANLSQFTTGMNASNQAQNLQRQRGQDMFNNNLTMGASLSGTAGSAYSSALTSDQQLMDAINALMTGTASEGVNAASHQENDAQNQLNQLAQMYALYKSMNSGGDAGKKP